MSGRSSNSTHRGPPASPLAHVGWWAQRPWLGILPLALWTLAVQWTFSEKIFFTGDEPHYLLSTVSFLDDGDFNLVNNFMRRDSYRFGYEHPLIPQWAVLDGRPIPAEHGTAFPILIAPVFALGGTTAVRVALITLGFISVVLAAAAAMYLTGRRSAGWTAGALIALAPAWQMQSSRVYPDMAAALCASVVLFVVARHAAKEKDTVTRWAGFLVGFCVCVPPVLYVKYGLLMAVLGLTALWMRPFRRSLAVYAGGATAAAIGALNVALYADQGALGGNFATDYSYLFTARNAFGRYWTQWFDAQHGLFVFEPYTILALWAAITYFRPARDARGKVLAGLSTALIVYTSMHAFWHAGPGYSVPGRYLTVVIPLVCVLVTCWLDRTGGLVRYRRIAVAAGAAVSVAIYVSALFRDVSLDFGFESYTGLFPFFWMSWKTDPAFMGATDYGLWGYFAVLAIVVSKTWDAWSSREVEEQGDTSPPRSQG